MNTPDEELVELRRRLERLEQEVAALRGTSAPPVAAEVARASVGAEPPPLPQAKAGFTRPKSMSDRIEEKFSGVSSTTWIAVAGAVIFLIGAVYGLTVLIQRGWVSPPVRIGTGLLTGLAVGLAATRLLLGGRREIGLTLLAVAVGTWTFALYFGSKMAHLIPLGAGFAGAAVAMLAAGALAARLRSDGAMGVALLVGLVTPLAFSDGTGSVPALIVYLMTVLGAQLAVHYATGEGADWKASRVLGSAGTWAVALIGSASARLGEPMVAFAALGGLAALALVLAWLPRHRGTAEAPGALSAVSLVVAALTAWQLWRRVPLEHELFSVVLAALALLSLGLWVWAHRTGRQAEETTLVLLATGFGLLAVPVAIEWRWVVLAWGVGAWLLAVGARRRSSDAARHAAVIVAFAATWVWLGQAIRHGRSDALFLNPVFGGAAFTAAAWFAVMQRGGWCRGFGFAAGQFVLVNAVAWELSRAIGPVVGAEANVALGAVLATLTYAGTGATLWLRGVIYESDAVKAKALRLSGYAWLAIAAMKLLAHDLGNRDLLFRAVAALGVGVVFIGAALWADRVRARRDARH